MEIKVLGTGCAGCKALYETVKQAVAETSSEYTVIKEEDLATITAFNVLALPALVVDGHVVSSGKKLSVTEVKAILLQYEKQAR